MDKQTRRLKRAHMRAAKIFLFSGTMAVFTIIGLLWFLRPDTSTIEKRTLTTFPKLTWSSFWDGTFFNDDATSSGVSIWYADTYPLREKLISGSQWLEDHYGIRSDQIIGGTQVAEEIPDAAASNLESESAAEPSEEPLPDGTVTEEGEMASATVYITQHCAYQLYGFKQDGADNYISLMNDIYDNIGDSVNMYTLIAPTATTVMLDQSILDSIGCSNEGDAINYMYSGLNSGIKTINAFDNLKKHNAEYIYFHTDHHWTALGAYYAYQAFCDAKGITAHNYEDYETMTFENYFGSLYASTNQSSELASNPDTVIAYIPKGTNGMRMNLTDGRTDVAWYIINDVSSYPNTEYYSTFAGSDNPFSYAHNETITDGSAVLLVKDSFGNAFLPWLVDHYEYIYWIDFRYTTDTVMGLVEKYGIQDVIFETNIFNAAGSSAQEYIRPIGTGTGATIDSADAAADTDTSAAEAADSTAEAGTAAATDDTDTSADAAASADTAADDSSEVPETDASGSSG